MDKIEVIKSETEKLLKKIITDFEIEVTEEEEIYHIIIKSEEEAPTVIGRHGETIRALQKILEVVFYKKFGQSISLMVNVNDYREKQKERLEGLASQFAEKTKSSGQPTYVRNFSSYERRIIHQYITDNYSDLTSYSVGEGKDRQLVIDLKKNDDSEKTETK